MSARVRRTVLGATAAAALLVGGCGGDNDEGKRKGEVEVEKIGLSVVKPPTWKSDAESDALELTSPDENITMSFSSPVEGREPAQVKRALIRLLKERLAPAQVTAEGPGRLGRRRVSSFQITGEPGERGGTAVGLVEDTQFRTYAITLIIGNPSAKVLTESRAILRSVQLDRPKGAKDPPEESQ